MKNVLMSTIAITGLLYTGAAWAQGQQQGGQACERLGAYMQENQDRDLGVNMQRLRQLQQSGDNELCREQLQVFEEAFGRRGQQFTQQGQQQDMLFGQTQQGPLNDQGDLDIVVGADQLTEQDRARAQQREQFAQGEQVDEQGRIIVRRTAPQIRVDQSEPRVTVRQIPADVAVSQGQPEIIVRQPAPQVTVRIPQPDILVRMPEPNVAVNQQPPQVMVRQPQPEVQVTQPQEQAQVMFGEDEQARVQIQRPQGQANVQVQRSGQPRVRYEAEEPQVSIQRAEGGPNVQIERMQTQEQAQLQQSPDVQLERDVDVAVIADAELERQRTEMETGATTATGNLRRITADELDGMPLMNARGEQLGEIEAIVLNTADNRTMAVIEHGGFLGLGDKRIVLPLENLSVMNDTVIVRGLTNEDIEAMPEWEENETRYRELGAGDQAEIEWRG